MWVKFAIVLVGEIANFLLELHTGCIQHGTTVVSSKEHASIMHQQPVLSSTDWRMLYVCAFFWVIPRRLNFICRRFGTFCLFHLHGQVGVE
jgi:hypothetical protein